MFESCDLNMNLILKTTTRSATTQVEVKPIMCCFSLWGSFTKLIILELIDQFCKTEISNG